MVSKYIIEVDQEQADAISIACELVSRMYMGQFESIRFNLGCFHIEDEDPGEIDKDLNAISRRLGLRPTGSCNAYYGICSKEVPDRARTLYDIHQVIRKKIAWDRNPEGGLGVHFQDPYKTDNNRSLPNVKNGEIK